MNVQFMCIVRVVYNYWNGDMDLFLIKKRKVESEERGGKSKFVYETFTSSSPSPYYKVEDIVATLLTSSSSKATRILYQHICLDLPPGPAH